MTEREGSFLSPRSALRRLAMEHLDEAGRQPVDWKEVEAYEVPRVLTEMTKGDKESLFIINSIRGCLKWSAYCPDVKTKIFRPTNIQWQRSILATAEGKVNSAFIFSPYKSYSFLIPAVSGNGIIKWEKEPMLFLAVPKEICDRLEHEITSVGAATMWNYTFNSYWLPSETAKKFNVDVPDGFTISRLDQSHAPTVNSVWPYASSTSLALASDMILVNETVGLFTEEASHLVSWILHVYYGLGMFYTVKEHRRHGHGTTVVKALSKRLAEERTEITLLAKEDNAEANAVFRKLGFQGTGRVQLIQLRSRS